MSVRFVDAELAPDSGFEPVERFGEFRVCYERVALLHEGTHYVDADLDSTHAIEHHGGMMAPRGGDAMERGQAPMVKKFAPIAPTLT